jgi:hypothetical protein
VKIRAGVLVGLLLTALPAPAAETPTSRGAVLVLKVADYDATRLNVLALAARHQGEVRSARTEVNFQGKRHGRMTLLVPTGRLDAALAEARGLGRLYSEALGAAEHASEHQELARREVRLREHEVRLAALLGGSRRLRGSDLLFIQERLFRAGVDQELLRQRRLDLERAGRRAELTVELFEPEPRRVADAGNWYAGATLRARTVWYALLARAVTAGTFALVFAPLWLPALLITLLLLRLALRRIAAWRRAYSTAGGRAD